MATATQVLRHEHDAILKMLDATEQVAQRAERGEKIPAEVLTDLLEFFRLFADRCHHGKEEDLLFPLLRKKGIPGEGGPIGMMLYEHEQGRSLIRQMAEAVEAYQSGQATAGTAWAKAARGYTDLLRSHINKENNVLFPMADRVLAAGEQASLAEEFERLEVEKMGTGTHERLHAKMDKLLRELARR